jgi:hypothetical protein
MVFTSDRITSNAPTAYFTIPSAARNHQITIIGKNIQYFRLTIFITRSCSFGSARKRASPSKTSPPMDNLTRGVFFTLRTHCRFTFPVLRQNLIITDIVDFLQPTATQSRHEGEPIKTIAL